MDSILLINAKSVSRNILKDKKLSHPTLALMGSSMIIEPHQPNAQRSPTHNFSTVIGSIL